MLDQADAMDVRGDHRQRRRPRAPGTKRQPRGSSGASRRRGRRATRTCRDTLRVVMPGAAGPPDIRERREDFFRPVLPLTPDGQAARRGLLPDDAESRDCRVPQKIDVRRMVNVALRHEGVRMRERRLAGLPSRDFVAVLHDRRVDLVDQLRREMADVVRQRPVLAFACVDEVRMAEKLADELVLVRVMRKAIEIAARSLLENPEHEDPPEVHSRTALPAVGAGKETGFPKPFRSAPEFPVRGERANAPENFRNLFFRRECGGIQECSSEDGPERMIARQ